MVFHTAPPQPESNARMICSPQLVGGADASQNGLRRRIPAKVVSSVGLGILSSEYPRGHPEAGALPIRDSVDHLAAAIRAVATGEVLRIRCLAARSVNRNSPALQLQL